jgi:hypothetical protein
MNYYVNKRAQSNGDHEVHTASCRYLPSENDRRFLGDFSNCADAVREAKRYYPQSNGCRFCATACHTQ